MDFPYRLTQLGYFRIITYFLKIEIILANKGDPDEMQHSVIFHLGLHCFLSTPSGVSSIQRVNSVQSRGHKTCEYEKNNRY